MERRQAGQNLRHSNKIVLLKPNGAMMVEKKTDYTPQIIVALGAIVSALIISRSRG
tara:strand:+ start:8065 stop:8232 length:168 start_codon:yes stop_codon:yes gene_type:complete